MFGILLFRIVKGSLELPELGLFNIESADLRGRRLTKSPRSRIIVGP